MISSKTNSDVKSNSPSFDEQMTKENAYILSIKKSCLFTNTYQQILSKHRKSQEEHDSESKESEDDDDDIKNMSKDSNNLLKTTETKYTDIQDSKIEQICSKIPEHDRI